MVGGAAPALQVIVLGSGGGPREDNTTALLVRSVAEGWRKGSLLAVDAGVHLSAISRLLEDLDAPPAKVTDGPFDGLEVHYSSASANAAYITRTLVSTYLITHPHLDHISGFVVNTAGLGEEGPKRLAALPSTIEAFKKHIFNNVIWPNLSDENNGAGLVTYMRLVEGGSPFGSHDALGYVEICEGLKVKAFVISHGHCIERHLHRASNAGISPGVEGGGSDFQPSRSPRGLSIPGDSTARNSMTAAYMSCETREIKCVYDSSAYFIRDSTSGKEVLIFGDVEPDSLSLEPRNRRVWREAAKKIASKELSGIFIECSYDNSVEDRALFGHMAPRHLIEELKVLAADVEIEVEARKKTPSSNGNGVDHRKRKRMNSSPLDIDQRSPHHRRSPRLVSSTSLASSMPASPSSPRSQTRPSANSPATPAHFDNEPLKGVKVIIIHVKQKLDGGPDERDSILEQLKADEEVVHLGCEFLVSNSGDSVYL